MRFIMLACILAGLLLVGVGCETQKHLERHVDAASYSSWTNIRELHNDVDRMLLLDKPSMCYPEFVND